MILSHRIQLDPTVKQQIYFARACGTARMVWNIALAEWNARYEIGINPNANELKRYFNSFKYKDFPWLKQIHRDAHTQPFANLQKAFSAFFKGGKSKRPMFKKKGKCRESFYVACDKLKVVDKAVRLPVIGIVRMTEAVRFAGKILSATVSREADRWFISISIEVDIPVAERPSGGSVGVDLGLKTFGALSDGRKIESPKPLASSMKRLQRLCKRHSRKKTGSNNRRKSAMKLARYHRRVRNIRQNFLHQITSNLAKTHSEICIEDLNVSGMVKNRCLSRAISDAGWSEFRRMLDYKCPLYGSMLTVRDRFFASSKICSDCGHRLSKLPLSVREWVCPICGSIHDRDSNAAKNLLNYCVPAVSREFKPVAKEQGAGVDLVQHETLFVEAGTTTGRINIRRTP